MIELNVMGEYHSSLPRIERTQARPPIAQRDGRRTDALAVEAGIEVADDCCQPSWPSLQVADRPLLRPTASDKNNVAKPKSTPTLNTEHLVGRLAAGDFVRRPDQGNGAH